MVVALLRVLRAKESMDERAVCRMRRLELEVVMGRESCLAGYSSDGQRGWAGCEGGV